MPGVVRYRNHVTVAMHVAGSYFASLGTVCRENDWSGNVCCVLAVVPLCADSVTCVQYTARATAVNFGSLHCQGREGVRADCKQGIQGAGSEWCGAELPAAK